MTLYNSLLLGLLQGLTEFLPISSSGHLVLMESYLGLSFDPSVLQHFDIVLHGGSLIAILIYFQKTWLKILRRPFAHQPDGSPPLMIILLAACIPVALVGTQAAGWIEINARTPLFVAFGFIATGSLLIASGWYESRFAARESLGWKQAIGASIGQALGVLPGFSRSGLTIASGRLMGLTAHRATEFAFLLGAPALGGALLLTLATGTQDLLSIGWMFLVVGFTASFISSLIAIHFFLFLIRKYGIWMWSAYLFIAASFIIADEMLPLIASLPDIIGNLELKVIIGILFIALLLEAIPFTSTFVPGFITMVAIGTFLHDDPWAIAACIPIGASALIIGHLIGYIPSRQARAKVRWKEKADQRLTKTQHFFKKYGFWAVFFGGWWAPFRPFISIAAGLGGMKPIPYLFAIVFGSFVWMAWVMIWSAIVFGGAF
jgi:undecaprenyl-diphosphatase